MIEIDKVIRIFIEYKGFRQGLFTDYGGVFDHYLNYYEKELKKCSMFEVQEKENSLAIRYRKNQYVIYHTDERAALWGIEYKYDDSKDATLKFLELFHCG